MRKLLLFILLISANLSAADPTPQSFQFIHEAFLQNYSDPVPLEVITAKPPAPQHEKKPFSSNPLLQWIPGYWAWHKEKKDFIWICGTWRLPPPNLTWSKGQWVDAHGGWVWVKGAWLPSSTKGVYSKTAPPPAQNEDTGAIPGADSFWSSGYWNYSTATGQFEWLSGSWQKFNPDWVLENAHWICRPEGYLFVPAYWDWNIESRGIAYDCMNALPIGPSEIAKSCSCCYPDFLPICCHTWHFHPQYWDGCGCVPVWWSWADWWSYPWNNHWWLWWWYSHPGYPAPPFIDASVINTIPPPPASLVSLFGSLPRPIFILPAGVPTTSQWLEAINKTLGSKDSLPLVAEASLQNISDVLNGMLPKTGTDRPGGSPGQRAPVKPAQSLQSASSGVAKIPSVPTLTLPVKPQVQIQPVKPAPIPEAPTAAPAPAAVQENIIVPAYQRTYQDNYYDNDNDNDGYTQYYYQSTPQYNSVDVDPYYPGYGYGYWGGNGWGGGYWGGRGGWDGGWGGDHHGGHHDGGHHGGWGGGGGNWGGGGHHGGGGNWGGGGGHHGGGGGGGGGHHGGGGGGGGHHK